MKPQSPQPVRLKLKPQQQPPIKDRYIVLKSVLPESQRLETDPREIYFVFDTQLNDWAETAPSKQRFYSESESEYAYTRANELNAVEREIRGNGV